MSCDIEDTCVCAQPCSDQRMCGTCPDCTPMEPDFDEIYAPRPLRGTVLPLHPLAMPSCFRCGKDRTNDPPKCLCDAHATVCGSCCWSGMP